MAVLNIKDFLTLGACLQTGPDAYKILIGPFKPVLIDEIEASESTTFLYKSNFWDFLSKDSHEIQSLVYSAADTIDLNREEFIRLLGLEDSAAPILAWNVVQETGFKEQFGWSQKLFDQKILNKTVPVILQEAVGQLTSSNKIWLLQNLLKNKSFGWSYAFFDGEKGMIGHTPESLVLWDRVEQKAQTMALAGTLAISEEAKIQILQDEKILQEHLYVVDDIEEKLKKFNATKENTEVLELKYLLHLKTRFVFKIESWTQFFESIESLHTTAAMGIFPYDKERLSEMSQFELQKKRGLFAGPFGCIEKSKNGSNDRARIVVPIRNLIFSENSVQIFSGCGITKASIYHDELNELENKRNSVKKMLGLLND